MEVDIAFLFSEAIFETMEGKSKPTKYSFLNPQRTVEMMATFLNSKFGERKKSKLLISHLNNNTL